LRHLIALIVVAALSWNLPSAVGFFWPDRDEVHTLVLLRHGESQWNLENRFTGWVDVDVSDTGIEEAVQAGRLMRDANLTFDVAFSSVQKRAIKTMQLALDQMDQLWIPVEKSWRLNERMYGGLQGLDKAETQQKYGEELVTQWRRSFDVPPPAIEDDHEFHPKRDPKYAGLKTGLLPLAESLELTIGRVLPFWRRSIAPELRAGKTVLVVAHGNSLRALVKYLDDLPAETIVGLNIPTAVPLVYKLNHRLKPILVQDHADGLSGAYLGDAEWVNSKIMGVKNQAKR